MGSIPREFPISLRSWPTKENDLASALPTLIQRINAERGGFRNLTEATLLHEIAETEAAAAADKGDGSSDGEDEEVKPDRLQEVLKARGEMMAFLEHAHNAASIAQDFMALLIAKDQNSPAASNLNSFLKDNHLIGTLGMDKMSPSFVTNAKQRENKAITTGWKMQNLNKTVDSILLSATRLEREIEVETKYWEQVLAINENGWAICRLPQEKHTMGVRFGFSESAPAFKSRSLAAIRRDAEGNITLDQGLAAAEPQALRVRIRTNNEDVGSSSIPSTLPDDAPIESFILQARDSIFSEELWQEVNREARGLAAYNVRSKEGTLICPLTPTKQLVLDLVPLGDGFTPPPKADNQVAEGISLALKILLSYVHRQHHRLHTHPRTPKSTLKDPNPPCTLLRPLITRLAHENTIIDVRRLLTPLCTILNSAGLAASYTTTPPTPSPKNMSRFSPTEAAVLSLIKGLDMKTTLQITPKVMINVISRTDMGPIVGSIFYISVAPQDCPLLETCRPPGQLDTWEKVVEYLLYATSCAVASYLSNHPDIEAPFTGDDSEVKDKEGWQSTYQPYTLRKKFKNGRNKQLSFVVQKDEPEGKTGGVLRATAKWQWLGDGRKLKGEGTYSWAQKVGAGAEAPGLDDGDDEIMEVVRTVQEVLVDAGRD